MKHKRPTAYNFACYEMYEGLRCTPGFPGQVVKLHRDVENAQHGTNGRTEIEIQRPVRHGQRGPVHQPQHVDQPTDPHFQ